MLPIIECCKPSLLCLDTSSIYSSAFKASSSVDPKSTSNFFKCSLALSIYFCT
nr:MAG TPA: hypothetical protein [Crassvirales sp.]DAJ78191.1 MAG TPA: hypothetical protein [Caudoviricetes sp.]DAT39819.1 MAG TPA: hypothetical protein [Caudoviricetes sp.]